MKTDRMIRLQSRIAWLLCKFTSLSKWNQTQHFGAFTFITTWTLHSEPRLFTCLVSKLRLRVSRKKTNLACIISIHFRDGMDKALVFLKAYPVRPCLSRLCLTPYPFPPLPASQIHPTDQTQSCMNLWILGLFKFPFALAGSLLSCCKISIQHKGDLVMSKMIWQHTRNWALEKKPYNHQEMQIQSSLKLLQ